MVHIPPTTAVPKFALAPPGPPPLPPPPPPQSTSSSSGRDVHPAQARFSLAGKTAIITGGAGGLGFEAARALAQHGASKIALFDVSAAHGHEALGRLNSEFPALETAFKTVDVASEDAVEGAVAAVAHEFGAVDMLLTFAGVVGVVRSVASSAEHWRRIIDVNTTGGFLCAKAVAKVNIRAKRSASIVFVASISGHAVNYPQPQAAYNVSKAGVLHLTRSLAAEWALHGIRVNSVSPGYMDTVLNEGDGLDEHRRMWCERTPMGRIGGREELNGALVLLCSDASTFITGSDIKIDGGISLLF